MDADELKSLSSVIESFLQVLSKTAQEVESRLQQTATLCGANWEWDSSATQACLGVIEMIKDVVEAEEWTVGQGASLQHKKSVEHLKGVIKEVTDILVENAKTAVIGGTPDGLLKALFIFDQLDQGIRSSAKQANIAAALDLEHTDDALQQVEEAIDVGEAGLAKRVDALLPFDQGGSQAIDVSTAVTVDLHEMDKVLLCLDALDAFSKAAGRARGPCNLLATVRDRMSKVVMCLKGEMDSILSDSHVEAEEVERMAFAMRAAVTLKREHVRIYALAAPGDFVKVAVGSLVRCHQKLKSDLMMAKDDMVKTEELLKVVCPLCRLDECLEDEETNFSDLYHEYEGTFRAMMDDHVQTVLGLVEEVSLFCD